MTPTDLLQWIIDNSAQVGPALLDNGKATGWYCMTRDMWLACGKTLQEAVEMCRNVKEE